jgi:UDP-N-acetylglucosamine:LPS N-acetylglucosamine transferase
LNHRKRFLILTSDTGLGHRSAANSVFRALQETHPFEVDATIVNPIFDQPSPAFLRKTQRDYDRNVIHNPEFYRFTYEISDSRYVASLVEGTMVLALFKSLQTIFTETRPDVILNTNLLFNAPMGSVLKACHADIPMYTVVTDLADVHSLWFNGLPDGYFVASESVKNKAIACGIPESKIIVTGIPVDPSLDPSRHNKKKERAALGLDPELPVFLFVGSPRVTGMMDYLRPLEKSNLKFQVAAIAGGNQSLFDDLSGREWGFPIQIRNFANNMPDWLACSDVLVTKAGGLILSEGLAAGLPVILFDRLPGQEDGNVAYLLDNKAGVCLEDPARMLSVVESWMADGGFLRRQLAVNAAKAGFPRSALEIAEILWSASPAHIRYEEPAELA